MLKTAPVATPAQPVTRSVNATPVVMPTLAPAEIDKLRDDYKVAADALATAQKDLDQVQVLSGWTFRWGVEPGDPGPPYFLMLGTPVIELPAGNLAEIPIEVLRRYVELRVAIDDWYVRGAAWPLAKQ